jgi:HK97 family phage major capsid protein
VVTASKPRGFIRYGQRAAQLAIEAGLMRPAERRKLSDEHRAAARLYKLDLDSDERSARSDEEIRIELPDTESLRRELRALSIQTGAAGGFTTPEVNFVAAWETALVSLPMRRVSTVERIDEGDVFREPTVNDSANEGFIVGENQQAQTQDVTFGLIQHRPTKYGSGRVLVPAELPEDSGPSFPSQLARVLGTRVSRLQNRSFTTGTGASEALGIIPACVQAGATVTANSSTAVVADDLFSLYDKLGSGYFDFERCAIMLHKDTLLAVRKLKDGSGRPLVRFENGRLDSFRVILNHHCPSTIASGTNGSILFGDFSYYHVKDFRTLRLIRYTEAHADTDQELWAAFQRSSGNLVDAGTHPVVALVHAKEQ